MKKQSAKEGTSKQNTNYKFLFIMSQLTKSASAQKKQILVNFRSFNVGAVAVLTAERVPFLSSYFERAGVPAEGASRSALVGWARANMLPLLPACTIQAVGGVCFTTNKEKALTFEEGTSADAFRNCGTLSSELGANMGDGKGRAVYFFRERSKRVPVVVADNGAAGKVYKVDEKTGARVYEVVTFREYITKRADTFTPAEMVGAFFSACGIPAAIAAEAAQALAEKAAKAVHAAEVAASTAANTATRAQEQAKKASERAQEKAAKAAEVRAAEGMTSEQAAKIVNEAEERKAAEQAEQAEQASKAKGENVRKKANTKTKASEQVTTK